MLAEFHVIVRCWRRRRGQPKAVRRASLWGAFSSEPGLGSLEARAKCPRGQAKDREGLRRGEDDGARLEVTSARCLPSDLSGSEDVLCAARSILASASSRSSNW